MSEAHPGAPAHWRHASYTTRHAESSERNSIIDRIETFPSVTISRTNWENILSTVNDGMSPSKAFAGEPEYHRFIGHARAAGVDPSAIPLLLLVDDEYADGIEVPDDVILRDDNGRNLALIEIREKFGISRKEFLVRSAGSGDVSIADLPALPDDGDTALAGDIVILRFEPEVVLQSERNAVSASYPTHTSGRKGLTR